MEQSAAPKPEIPKTVRPTKKQRQLLEFIDAFIKEHGYSPSYREIMTGLNYTSVATVALHIKNLIRRGHIIKRDYSARSLEVVYPLDNDPPKIKTNEIDPSEEKWLLQKVDHYFTQVESEAVAPAETLADMEAVIKTLQLLGIEAGSQQFLQRFHDLANTRKVR